MDAATVLSQVDQEQFKQDVISALTNGQQPLNPNVQLALNKLSRKKSFKITELRELFLIEDIVLILNQMRSSRVS